MISQQEIELLLGKNDYDKLVDYLEIKVEIEPDNIDYHCYLGLAYLLSGKKEEAQMTWFFLFSQEDNHSLTKLSNILNIEAQRQLEQQNFLLSYELRQVIREIKPHDIQNLTFIVKLAIQLNILNNDYIQELSLLDTLKNINNVKDNRDNLYQFCELILDFPFFINIDLIDVILEKVKEDQNFLTLIISKARIMGYEKRYLYYSVDLLKLCLKYFSNDLKVIKEFFWYYMEVKEYENAIIFADKYIQDGKNKEDSLHGNYLKLYLMLTTGNWFENLGLFDSLYFLLNDLDLEKIDNDFKTSLIAVCQFYLYFKDNPLKFRSKILTKVMPTIQNYLNREYSSLIKHDRQVLRWEKIRIAYIAHTFNNHCVAMLCRYLINYLNKDKFDVYIYMLDKKEDNITEKWFKSNVDKYIQCSSDWVETVKQIQEDNINILIDLDSFTHYKTQMIMALKLAPIQISWLGLDSTGLPTLDYFIVDPHVLPNNAQEYYREQLWRLPHTYLAVDGFEVGISSIKRQDLDIPENAIVYLSLQTGLKRHPDSIALQMKILAQVPDSYFLISGGTNECSLENVKKIFTQISIEQGVNPDRIKVLPFLPTEEYRGILTLGDVVLDTYPFNGATTTLDALWLNIPLVTRVGEQFHARQGYTFLKNLGIEEGIAYTDEEYIEWGVRFGKDEELRKKVYWKLRESKKTSPLWNGKQFAREMEKAYEQMWEIYVNQQNKITRSNSTSTTD
ncbi:O-linked N-acetylglucosamine transferase, SPINDLY family protein [Geminocystis sp. CENA526]|uniref:O-linked N-acetylglucosamine transferase, SPINDLY family protein n=1 Tax=Geminocystis sp. CENA526 TaxID=1355871 RepID=UPI003D6F9172